MHLGLLTLVTFTCFCIYTTHGDFENCCLAYDKVGNPRNIYKHVLSVQLQEISESCNMRALVLHLKKKQRVICVNPYERWVHLFMKQKHRRQYSKQLQLA
ncbi:C-C motif chemokine 25 [Pelodytes ibericus]